MKIYRDLNEVDIAKILAKYFHVEYNNIRLYTEEKTVGYGYNETTVTEIKAKVVEENIEYHNF